MLKFLHNLFFPHSRNNHRAKLLHNSSLFILILLLFSATYMVHLIKTAHPDILGVSYSISDSELLAQVNAQRQSAGLPALTIDDRLSDAARRKAADMFAKNYWAHFAPDGSTSPWGFIKASGYNYSFAGENLAKGFTNSSSVVSAWMASPSHRDNILSSKYRNIGFAIVPGTLQGEDTVLVVEMFGTPVSPTLAQISQVSAAQSVPVKTVPEKPASASPVIAQISPSITPTITPVSQGSTIVLNKPKIDTQITSRAASTIGLSFIAFAFVMDLVIVERKKIPRIVGHNIDHIMLIVMFVLFMILAKGGATL